MREPGSPAPSGGSRCPRGPCRTRPPVAAPAACAVVIGCFGHMNTAKRVPQLLACLSPAPVAAPEAQLVLAGSQPPAVRSRAQAAERGLSLGDSVVHHDYLAEAVALAADRRRPTCSSTSAADDGRDLCDASSGRSRLGKPLVVSDVGWFSELPDQGRGQGSGRAETRSRRCPRSSMRSPRTRAPSSKWEGAAAEYARRSTISTGPPICTWRRSKSRRAAWRSATRSRAASPGGSDVGSRCRAIRELSDVAAKARGSRSRGLDPGLASLRFLRAHAPALALVAVVIGSAARLGSGSTGLFQGRDPLRRVHLRGRRAATLRRPGTSGFGGGPPLQANASSTRP